MDENEIKRNLISKGFYILIEFEDKNKFTVIEGYRNVNRAIEDLEVIVKKNNCMLVTVWRINGLGEHSQKWAEFGRR